MGLLSAEDLGLMVLFYLFFPQCHWLHKTIGGLEQIVSVLSSVDLISFLFVCFGLAWFNLNRKVKLSFTLLNS